MSAKKSVSNTTKPIEKKKKILQGRKNKPSNLLFTKNSPKKQKATSETQSSLREKMFAENKMHTLLQSLHRQCSLSGYPFQSSKVPATFELSERAISVINRLKTQEEETAEEKKNLKEDQVKKLEKLIHLLKGSPVNNERDDGYDNLSSQELDQNMREDPDACDSPKKFNFRGFRSCKPVYRDRVGRFTAERLFRRSPPTSPNPDEHLQEESIPSKTLHDLSKLEFVFKPSGMTLAKLNHQLSVRNPPNEKGDIKKGHLNSGQRKAMKLDIAQERRRGTSKTAEQKKVTVNHLRKGFKKGKNRKCVNRVWATNLTRRKQRRMTYFMKRHQVRREADTSEGGQNLFTVDGALLIPNRQMKRSKLSSSNSIKGMAKKALPPQLSKDDSQDKGFSQDLSETSKVRIFPRLLRVDVSSSMIEVAPTENPSARSPPKNRGTSLPKTAHPLGVDVSPSMMEVTPIESPSARSPSKNRGTSLQKRAHPLGIDVSPSMTEVGCMEKPSTRSPPKNKGTSLPKRAHPCVVDVSLSMMEVAPMETPTLRNLSKNRGTSLKKKIQKTRKNLKTKLAQKPRYRVARINDIATDVQNRLSLSPLNSVDEVLGNLASSNPQLQCDALNLDKTAKIKDSSFNSSSSGLPDLPKLFYPVHPYTSPDLPVHFIPIDPQNIPDFFPLYYPTIGMKNTTEVYPSFIQLKSADGPSFPRHIFTNALQSSSIPHQALPPEEVLPRILPGIVPGPQCPLVPDVTPHKSLSRTARASMRTAPGNPQAKSRLASSTSVNGILRTQNNLAMSVQGLPKPSIALIRRPIEVQPKMHKCLKCTFETPKLGVLKRHQLVHSKNNSLSVPTSENLILDTRVENQFIPNPPLRTSVTINTSLDQVARVGHTPGMQVSTANGTNIKIVSAESLKDSFEVQNSLHGFAVPSGSHSLEKRLPSVTITPLIQSYD